MLTYRGDIFVKGKKFKINESLYRFQKRDNKDRLVFESIDTNETIRLTDSEFKESNKPIIKEAGDRIRGEIRRNIETPIDVDDIANKPDDKAGLDKWRDYTKTNPWGFKSNNKSQCPKCNARLLTNYGYDMTSKNYAFDDDGWFSIQWKCRKCGTQGVAIFRTNFWSQGVYTKDGMVEVRECGIEPEE